MVNNGSVRSRSSRDRATTGLMIKIISFSAFPYVQGNVHENSG